MRSHPLLSKPPLIVVMCTLMMASAPAAPDQVVRLHVDDPALLGALEQLSAETRDLELWSEALAPGAAALRVTHAGLALLDALGVEYSVLIPDVDAHFAAQYAGGDPDDFFSTIRTYAEHEQFLHGLAATYPDLAEVSNVGQSVNGRTLWALHITGRGRVKPGVIYHGAQHGNEKAGASIAAYVANHLLTNYGADPTVTALVDHADWYILPIMNPDGYVGNRRQNTHNVDLNRNWGGPGSGQAPTGGPYPFSEPETAALRDFLVTHPTVRVHVDLHGYTNKIMGPWGHKVEPSPHHARFLALEQDMAALVLAAGGGTYSVGPVYSTLYYISGGSTDYSYGVLGVWGFLIEVRDATMPNICHYFLDPLLYLGDWIWNIDCNGNGVDDVDDLLAGTSRDRNGNGQPDECEPLGDLNCDDYKDNEDIDPFVLALTDPAGYAAAWPGCALLNADINGDGVVDNEDIDPFVGLITGR